MATPCIMPAVCTAAAATLWRPQRCVLGAQGVAGASARPSGLGAGAGAGAAAGTGGKGITSMMREIVPQVWKGPPPQEWRGTEVPIRFEGPLLGLGDPMVAIPNDNLTQAQMLAFKAAGVGIPGHMVRGGWVRSGRVRVRQGEGVRGVVWCGVVRHTRPLIPDPGEPEAHPTPISNSPQPDSTQLNSTQFSQTHRTFPLWSSPASPRLCYLSCCCSQGPQWEVAKLMEKELETTLSQ